MKTYTTIKAMRIDFKCKLYGFKYMRSGSHFTIKLERSIVDIKLA